MLFFWSAPGLRHFSTSIRADRNIHLEVFLRLQGVSDESNPSAVCVCTLRLKCIAWVRWVHAPDSPFRRARRAIVKPPGARSTG